MIAKKRNMGHACTESPGFVFPYLNLPQPGSVNADRAEPEVGVSP
jgi:hypothetical protein